jgi:YegS/Rv2252/BmrU family lipid kinase
VHITSGRGDALNYISEQGSSAERIICIGGDGTLSEVISGLKYNNIDIPIGYIPTGTANDFANSLDISKNILQATENIISGNINLIDLGKFGSRYFTYIASFGAFTQVSYNTPQNSKNMLGHLAYIIEGIKELPNIRPEYIKIKTQEHNIEGEYIFGAVINSKSIGKILAINSDMSDGLFEVMLIKPLNNLMAVLDCVYSLISQNYNPEYITFFKADKIEVCSDPNLKWSLDGECENGNANIIIENLHLAVKIIT